MLIADQLRQLRSIRRSVPLDALHTLIQAFIASCMDYCNAVLYGVTDAVIRRLQAVLHTAARLITGVRRNDHDANIAGHTTLALRVSRLARTVRAVTFKVALMTYDNLWPMTNAKTYFCDVCIPVVSVAGRP